MTKIPAVQPTARNPTLPNRATQPPTHEAIECGDEHQPPNTRKVYSKPCRLHLEPVSAGHCTRHRSGCLLVLQDEEQEAEEGPRGRSRYVGEPLACAGCGGRFADDCDPEAGRGELAGHRVQWPVPVRQYSGLAAEGVFVGPLLGREVVA